MKIKISSILICTRIFFLLTHFFRADCFIFGELLGVYILNYYLFCIYKHIK